MKVLRNGPEGLASEYDVVIVGAGGAGSLATGSLTATAACAGALALTTATSIEPSSAPIATAAR